MCPQSPSQAACKEYHYLTLLVEKTTAARKSLPNSQKYECYIHHLVVDHAAENAVLLRCPWRVPQVWKVSSQPLLEHSLLMAEAVKRILAVVTAHTTHTHTTEREMGVRELEGEGKGGG